MEVLLNTIAIEPNRWTPGKIPYRPLVELLAPISAAGFTAVEVWQNHAALLDDDALAELRAEGDACGVSFRILGMYPKFHLEGDERAAELARFERMAHTMEVLGASMLKVMPGQVASAKMTGELWDRSVGFVKEVLQRTARTGFLMPMETHDNTLGDAPEPLLRFIQAVGSDRLKVCFQPMDFSSYEATAALYDQLAPQVVHFHLQGRKGMQMSLLEEADIDYERLLARAFASGFDGALSIEFVKDCVVETPEQLDLDRVLSNAARDREFVCSVAGFGA